MEVGKRIAKESVTDFYYTYASSTNPPDYQRYRFYTENGQYFFYHEKREGDHWPLTENDVTVSGTRELTDAEWDVIIRLLMLAGTTHNIAIMGSAYKNANMVASIIKALNKL